MQLPIKGRAPLTYYNRSEFGSLWADIDRNGCDTRNDILKRDLIRKTFRAGTRNLSSRVRQRWVRWC